MTRRCLHPWSSRRSWHPSPITMNFSFVCSFVALSAALHAAAPAANTLSEEEQRSGWKLLWDGETDAGWRSARSDAFPAHGWKMKEGVLSVLKSAGLEGGAGGDIV